MYIPSTFFGTQGSCITATTTSITGSGAITTGSFISGGLYWQYYQFEMTDNENSALTSFTASLNILSGSTGQAKILIVGGGGTGAQTGNVDDGSIRAWEVVTSGGGGAGGVVYYDNFPISSGSYTIGIGKATSGPGGFSGNIGGGNFTTGKLGQPSWIKLPDNKTYTPFSTPYLIANGGGGASSQGSFLIISPKRVFIRDFDGQNTTSSLLLGDLQNGSGGGGGNVPSSTIGGGTPGTNGGNGASGQGGLNGVSQGNTGGLGLGGSNLDGYCINGTGVGGGGAGAAGGNRQLTAGGDASSGGGNGAVFNLTGTPTYYAGGGGGSATGGGGATGRGLGNYGCGGNGSLYGSSMNGQAGVVIIAWPICSANFSCKTFDITGSTGTLSYLPCNLPYVTQSKASNPQDYFSACLLTWSGSNTPVLLTGETTASAGAECGNQFTQSYDCNCQYLRAVAGSGTQTLTYFPCNGTASVTTTVGTGGSNFCIENLSIPTLTGIGSTFTYYGNCKAGTTCTGIQYTTSSVVNCTSVLATAGSGGGTLTWLPCSSGSATSSYLAPFQSMSVCAGLLSSFLDLTGIGSTFQYFGACSASIDLPYSIIQNCSSSVTASALFSGKYYPSTGFTFISNTTGTGSCWNVIGTASIAAPATYTNLITQSSFTNCATCETSLIPFGRVSWSFSENSQDGLFTIYDNANTITTLSGSGTGNTIITAQHYVTASLTPVNYPITGAVVMNIYANGNTVTQSFGTSANTTITSSFLVPSGSRTSITASITYYPNGIPGMKSYVFLAGPFGATATYRLAGDLTNSSTELAANQSIQVCAYTNSVNISGGGSKQFVGPDCGNVFTASCDCYSASFTAGILPPYAIQYIPCSSSVFTYVLLDSGTFSGCISYPSQSLATAGQSGSPTSSLSLSGSCKSGNCP